MTWRLAWLCVGVLAGLGSTGAKVKTVGTRPAVIGYLFPQDRLLEAGQISADKLTHINYAFANIRDGQVVEGFAHDTENFKVLAGVRRSNPHLKVLVSVGGWTWSGGFSDAVLTPERRQRFVQSAVDFVRRHDLDGFDVDWEYPGLPGNGNTHRPEDKANFTSVMADLRAALDKDAAARGKASLLTFAAGAFPAFIDHTEMAKVQASVDFVNLMTYDFRVASVDRIAGHHANLYDAPNDEKHRSADRTVREFLAAGVPAAKLVMGVPFYGRGWRDVHPGADGLYQPGVAVKGMNLSYGQLAGAVIGRDGFSRYWDATAQAPFLWNANQRIFISYDDPESLRLKANYVRARGLGGVMFWQYSEDPSGALLEALHTNLNPAR
jgi:chitinase